MKLEEIQTQWENDSKIERSDLGEASLKTPSLHSKYIKFLGDTKLLLRKSNADYLRIRKTKTRYFRGELDKHELVVLGWEQYQGRSPLKSEIDELIETDADIIRLVDKIEYYSTMQMTLESIMKSISSRGWDIKNGIEWIKIQNAIV